MIGKSCFSVYLRVSLPKLLNVFQSKYALAICTNVVGQNVIAELQYNLKLDLTDLTHWIDFPTKTQRKKMGDKENKVHYM